MTWQPDAQRQLDAIRDELLSCEERAYRECLRWWEESHNAVILGVDHPQAVPMEPAELFDAKLRAKVAEYETRKGKAPCSTMK